MGSKRFDYLHDLTRHNATLVVKCSCGHEARLEPFPLLQHAGKGKPDAIYSVVGRMRCSKCGRKGPDWWPEG